MAQSVKPPSLGFRSGHDLRVMGSRGPRWTRNSAGSLLEIFFLPLLLSLPLLGGVRMRAFSLSKNKQTLKKKKEKNVVGRVGQHLTFPVCLVLSFSCTLPILAPFLKFLVVSLTSEPILRPPVHQKQAHTHCVNSSPPGRRHQDAPKGARRFIERKAKEGLNTEEHCQAALKPRSRASGYMQS